METSRKNLYMIIAIIFLAGVASYGDQRKIPENIIIMIADGGGFNHFGAASLYQYGKKGSQKYEKFPVKLGMSTYPAAGSYDPKKAWSDFGYVTNNATDSAAAATAIATGVKSYNGAIGVNTDKIPVINMIERCEQIGKSTGVISSVPWTHATPAGFVAHNEKRSNCREISEEMIFQSAVEVIMGAGHPYYNDNGKLKSKPSFKYISKKTWQGLSNNTAASDADGDNIADTWTLIQSKQQFADLLTGETPKRICGTFQAATTLQEKRSDTKNAKPFEDEYNLNVPSLRDMSLGAINVLDDNRKGFFLMIEGGAVDWASHSNNISRTIEEQIEFNRAVEAVIEWVENNSSWEKTLLIVTADHETGYLTGPDSGETEKGVVWNTLTNNGQNKVPGYQWNEGGHTNSLVPFYAKGTGCKLFKRAAKNRDSGGKYLDNTDIANTIFRMLE